MNSKKKIGVIWVIVFLLSFWQPCLKVEYLERYYDSKWNTHGGGFAQRWHSVDDTAGMKIKRVIERK